MKKRMWLCFLLFFLAAVDRIGIDFLLMQSVSIHTKAQTDDDASDNDTDSENSDVDIQTDLPDDIAAAIRTDLVLFPIPKSSIHPSYQASYEDSWMSERTYGGARGHEGTDIMLSPDERGLFPVLSMTDGIVEKKGWLPKGGYRLGIRSDSGMYYYYAHLADYADDLSEGTSVVAGQLLGFAGDTGYSNIEGTVGNFPVHLHVGIYYNDTEGTETAVNPYPFLTALSQVSVPF